MSDVAIKTTKLTKMYGNALAVNGLELQVKKGSIYGFLGRNGAGKTTTIKLLLNLIYPTSGQAWIFGHDVVTEGLQVRGKVGYVAEEPIIYDYMKVSEVVNFCKDTYSNWDMAVVGRYIDLFELPVGKKVKELSKGMKNQLALAAALGCKPELLILDEPTGGLDPIKTKEFFGVILEQVAETGQTVFFSSHRLDEVERVADWVGIIDNGQLVFDKSMDDLKTQLKNIRVVFENEKPLNGIRDLPGIRAVTPQGRGYLVQCEGGVEEIVTRLNEFNPIDIEVIDVSLEDIFIRYTGGKVNV